MFSSTENRSLKAFATSGVEESNSANIDMFVRINWMHSAVMSETSNWTAVVRIRIALDIANLCE